MWPSKHYAVSACPDGLCVDTGGEHATSGRTRRDSHSTATACVCLEVGSSSQVRPRSNRTRTHWIHRSTCPPETRRRSYRTGLAALPGGNTALLPGDRSQSLQSLVGRGRAAGLPVRAYLSCVLGCPYEGPVSPERWRPSPGDCTSSGSRRSRSTIPSGQGRRSPPAGWSRRPLTRSSPCTSTTPAARHRPTSWRASG